MPTNLDSPRRLQPRLIVLDLDGTLIDSVPDLATALALAFADYGLPAHSPAAVRAMLGEGQRMLVQRALLAVGENLERTDEVLARYRHHYSEHLYDATRCYPGVVDTLRRLPATIAKGVATNKPGKWARQLTAHFGLDESLRWVLGDGDVSARKPDPAMLLTLCERAQVAPADALMVGDSHIDIDAAHAAGMPMALCTYGYCDPDILAAAQKVQPSTVAPRGSRTCPYLLATFADLLHLVNLVAPDAGSPSAPSAP